MAKSTIEIAAKGGSQAKGEIEKLAEALDKIGAVAKGAASALDKAGKETKEAGAAAKKSESEVSKLKKQFGSARAGIGKFKGVIIAVAAAIYGAVASVRALTDAYAVQEQAERKLTQIIKATGNAAGFTAGELMQQASALQEVTTFGDESIINAQALIATFKNIKGDEFARTTEMALDLSAALGQDLKSSSIQLGKALDDPIRGVSSLSEVGVTFTQAQRDMIAELDNAGERAKAQGLVLDVLAEQVGGVAAAMADTATGQITQFSNAWGDVKEEAGAFLLEVGGPLISWAKDFATETASMLKSARIVREAIRGMFTAESDPTKINEAIAEVEKRAAELRQSLREAEPTSLSSYGLEEYSQRVAGLEAELAKLDRTRSQLGRAVLKQGMQAGKQAQEQARREKENAAAAAEAARKAKIAGAQSVINATELGKKKLELKSVQEQIATLVGTTVLSEAEALTVSSALITLRKQEKTAIEEINAALAAKRALEKPVNNTDGGSVAIMATLDTSAADFDAVEAKNKRVAESITKTWSDYGSTVMDSISGAYSAISSTAQQYAQAEITRLQEQIDAFKASEEQKVQAMVDGGMMRLEAQDEYNAQLAELEKKKQDKENALKKKVWLAQKFTDIASAGIATALAAVRALTVDPTGTLTAIVSAFGAAQVAAIAAQKYPGLAAGGIVPAQGMDGGLYRLGDKNKPEAVIPLDQYNRSSGGMKVYLNIQFTGTLVGSDGIDEFVDMTSEKIGRKIAALREDRILV